MDVVVETVSSDSEDEAEDGDEDEDDDDEDDDDDADADDDDAREDDGDDAGEDDGGDNAGVGDEQVLREIYERQREAVAQLRGSLPLIFSVDRPHGGDREAWIDLNNYLRQRQAVLPREFRGDPGVGGHDDPKRAVAMEPNSRSMWAGTFHQDYVPQKQKEKNEYQKKPNNKDKKKREKKKKRPSRDDRQAHRIEKKRHKHHLRQVDWDAGHVPDPPPKFCNKREKKRLDNLEDEKERQPHQKKPKPRSRPGHMTHKDQLRYMAGKTQQRISVLVEGLGLSREQLEQPVELDHTEKKTDKTQSGRYPQSSYTTQDSKVCQSVKKTLNTMTGNRETINVMTGDFETVADMLGKVVEIFHPGSIEMSLACDLYLKMRFEKSASIPQLDSTFFRDVFIMVTEEDNLRNQVSTFERYPGLIDCRTLYFQLRSEHSSHAWHAKEPPNMEKTSRLRNQLVEQYKSACQNYVVDFLPTLIGRYVNLWLDVKTRQPAKDSGWEKLERNSERASFFWMIRHFFIARLCWKETETRMQYEYELLQYLTEELDADVALEVLAHALIIQTSYYVTTSHDNHDSRRYFLLEGNVLHLDNFWMYLPLMYDLQRTMEDWAAKDPKHQETVETTSVLPPADNTDAEETVHAEKVKQSKTIPHLGFHVKHLLVNKSTVHELLFHLEGTRMSAASHAQFRDFLGEYFPGALEFEDDRVEVNSIQFDGYSATVNLKPRSSREGAGAEEAKEPPSKRRRTRDSSGIKDFDPFTVEEFLDSILSTEEERRQQSQSMLRFVFIDPGEKQVITFMESGRKGGMSNEEYHQKRQTEKIKKRAENMRIRYWNEKEAEEEGIKAKLEHLEKNVSPKTPHLDKYKEYLKALFPVFDYLVEYHQTKAVQALRFTSYHRKQKALEAICNRIYNCGELRNIRNTLIVPVFGDANFMGKGRKRRRLLVPIISLKRLLRAKQRRRQGRLCFLDEFRSSKLCFGCFKELNAFTTEKGAKLFTCRVCNNNKCNRVHCNRDNNAALNFIVLFFFKVVLKIDPPVEFQRTRNRVEHAVENL